MKRPCIENGSVAKAQHIPPPVDEASSERRSRSGVVQLMDQPLSASMELRLQNILKQKGRPMKEPIGKRLAISAIDGFDVAFGDAAVHGFVPSVAGRRISADLRWVEPKAVSLVRASHQATHHAILAGISDALWFAEELAEGIHRNRAVA
jgi:hypothetical protein